MNEWTDVFPQSVSPATWCLRCHLLCNLSCLFWRTATPSPNTQSLCLCHPWETMNGLLPTPHAGLPDFTTALLPIPMTKPWGPSRMMNVPGGYALCEVEERDICRPSVRRVGGLHWEGDECGNRDGDHTFGHSFARRCCEPEPRPRGKTGWSERLERKGEDDAGSGSDKCNPSLQPCVGSLVRREAKECRGLACGWEPRAPHEGISKKVRDSQWERHPSRG